MDKDIVIEFMENFGLNDIADVCVLWLMRKNHLYFRPYTKDVVRRLLLEFCFRETENIEELYWKRWGIHFTPVSLSCCFAMEKLQKMYFQNNVENKKTIKSDNNDHFSVEQATITKERNYIVDGEERYQVGELWKTFYNKVVIEVIYAKLEVIEKLYDIDYIVKTLQEIFNKIDSIELKEEYIYYLFKGYSESLLNRILSYSEPNEVNNSANRTTMVQMGGYSRHSILAKNDIFRYYTKGISREQFAANNLLGMITTTQSIQLKESDVVIAQLGCLANSLSQIVEVIKSLIDSNGITIEDLEKKYGKHISSIFSMIVSSQNGQAILPNNKEIVKLPFNLTGILNTKRARWIFDKAIKKEWIKIKSDGTPEWLGLKKRGKDAQFAYLCGEIYGYKQSENGNAGNKMPSNELSDLFGIGDIYDKLRQVHNGKNVQPWQGPIDDLIKECPES